MINHNMTSTVSVDKLLNIKSKVCSLEMALILSGESEINQIPKIYVLCKLSMKD